MYPIYYRKEMGNESIAVSPNAYGARTLLGTHYGVRLAFKLKPLAEYAAEQFIDIYNDFCYRRNKL